MGGCVDWEKMEEGQKGEGCLQVRVFVQVDCLEGEFAQTLSAILIGSGVGGDTSTAEARADSAFVCHDCGFVEFVDVEMEMWVTVKPGGGELANANAG